MTDPASTPSSALEHLREVISHLDTCMSGLDQPNADPIASIGRPLSKRDSASEIVEPYPQLPTPPVNNPLHASASMAEAVFHHSQDAVIVLVGSACVAVNPAARAIFGGTEAELQEQNFFDVIASCFNVAPNWKKNLQEQLLQESSVIHELQKDDIESWFEFRFLKLELNEKEHLLVNVVDVTDRKIRENELAKQCDFLIRTINAVPEPVSVKSSGLELVLVNDSFCETHNVNREEVIGTSAAASLNGANLKESAYYEREVLATGIKQATIDAFFNDNHEPFILSTYHSSFNDRETGRPFVVAASRDVTTEMKRENRLRLLASVFEAAQEGVAILSPQGAICEANPEFIATIGKSHAKVLGTCLSTVVNCEPHHFTEIIELAQAGRPWFGNIKMINKRHEEIPCWLSLSPSKNLKGETTNLIAMISDITQIEETKARTSSPGTSRQFDGLTQPTLLPKTDRRSDSI